VTDETLTRRVQAARRAAAPALWHALVADLEAARAQNPAQAPALAALAVSYMALFDAGITPAGAASRDLYDRATAAADAALALDDHLADAHVVIGCYNYTYRWDAVTADRALRRALALAPDSGLARSRYGLCLALRGQFAAAVPQAERAVQLEPDVPELVVFLGRVNYLAGRADEAVACYEQALALAPELTATQFHLGLATGGAGVQLRAAHRCCGESRPSVCRRRTHGRRARAAGGIGVPRRTRGGGPGLSDGGPLRDARRAGPGVRVVGAGIRAADDVGTLSRGGPTGRRSAD
jgi:tetratricopeptide (TPR) repeat protein